MGVSLSLSRPLASGEGFDLARIITPGVLENMTGQRHDAASTAFFLRELTQIYETTYDVKYADKVARTLLDVDTRINPGAESFVWRQYDKVGLAKVVDSYAEDFPNVEVQGKEFQTRLVSIGASYQYTLQDLRAAQMAGLPLEAKKAQIVREVMENAIESIACVGLLGSPALLGAPAAQSATDYTQLFGLANFPNIIAGGTSGYTTNSWLTATVAQIMADINGMQKAIFTQSKGVHRADTLVLGTDAYAVLATTDRSQTYTDDTLLQYVLKQSPWLKQIIYWPALDTAGTLYNGGSPSGAGPRVLMMERKPENAQLVISQEFEQLPPQLRNMAFRVPCHMRTGGVTVRYPLSIAYLDGTSG